MSAAYRFANNRQPNISAMANSACGFAYEPANHADGLLFDFGLLFADDSRQIAQSHRWRCRT